MNFARPLTQQLYFCMLIQRNTPKYNKALEEWSQHCFQRHWWRSSSLRDGAPNRAVLSLEKQHSGTAFCSSGKCLRSGSKWKKLSLKAHLTVYHPCSNKFCIYTDIYKDQRTEGSERIHTYQLLILVTSRKWKLRNSESRNLVLFCSFLHWEFPNKTTDSITWFFFNGYIILNVQNVSGIDFYSITNLARQKYFLIYKLMLIY